MRSTFLSDDNNEPLNVLCLGAHCDDIEIGCGGALLELLKRRSSVNVYWQVYTSTPSRREEAIRGAERICVGAQSLEIDVLEFRDGYLPYEGAAVKDAFERTKRKFSPDLIFTHYRHDLHQDHRKISELTWNTFRDHIIWEYEIPKWDGDLGSPNVFVSLSESVAEEKISILQSVYNSQNDKKWFTEDFFSAMLRIRGVECNSQSGLAEGFYVRKNIVSFGT
jgi:LmbE family N-acetylglucosaminyl deacetylase